MSLKNPHPESVSGYFVAGSWNVGIRPCGVSELPPVHPFPTTEEPLHIILTQCSTFDDFNLLHPFFEHLIMGVDLR